MAPRPGTREGRAATPAAPVSPPYTPLVIRSLAVAALAALGQAGDANLEQVNGLMTEPNAGACLNLSKLNLYQCLAVSKPHYEDVFCLGEHVMMDTGRCLMKSSGAAMPLEIKPKPLDVTYREKPKAKPKAKAAAWQWMGAVSMMSQVVAMNVAAAWGTFALRIAVGTSVPSRTRSRKALIVVVSAPAWSI